MGKLDTRAIGLDAGLHFVRWLTGAENLHYGYWHGLDPIAANAGAAQNAYTDLLFSYLPEGRLRILDIGGGAGETAKKLLALGHSVDIVVPSALLADRCRQNAPGATVHECKFEALRTDERFDLCLYSESFQYIPLSAGLSGALALLNPGGEILIADCFRSAAYKRGLGAMPGGGHPEGLFRKTLGGLPLVVISERDITAEVAPSIDLEQGLFNVIGHVAAQLDSELGTHKPAARWVVHRLFGLALNRKRRARLTERLTETRRSAEAFCIYNVYQIVRLKRAD